MSAYDPAAYRDAHPAVPVLVVEVADARAALAECWIIDVARGLVEVHRAPERDETARYGWRYAGVETLRPPATVMPLVAAPTATIAVADLVP